MGAGPTKFQLSILPGRPKSFKEESKVMLWHLGRNPKGELSCDTAVITKVHPKAYDIKVDRTGEQHFKVPYYFFSYPNEKRTWKDYFLEGQRVLYKEKIPCVIINHDIDEESDHYLALRDMNTGRIHMKVQPAEISWDYTYFS
jgi:hypothetical protein